MESEKLDNHYCDCGKLLFKSSAFSGKIEIKCKRCKSVKTFRYAPSYPSREKSNPPNINFLAQLKQ